jgi:hypothetical protein
MVAKSNQRPLAAAKQYNQVNCTLQSCQGEPTLMRRATVPPNHLWNLGCRQKPIFVRYNERNGGKKE